MTPSLLTRRSLSECLRLLGFYLVSFLVLISIAVTAPLVRGGAPLADVLAFLPEQMALPATLALPLALVTSLLVTIGRMRDDGELIALQAAGISTLRVALALLPLAVATSLLVAVMSHLVLPDSFQRWREGKSSLLRQAIATKVARRELLYRDDQGTALAAHDVNGDRLLGLFARHRDENGVEVTVYAPEARWVAIGDPERDAMALHLQLEDARLLAAGGGTGTTHSTGSFPSLVVRLEQPNPLWATKADTRPTTQLGRTIETYREALDLLSSGASRDDLVADLLHRAQPPLDPSEVASWPRLLDHLDRDQALSKHIVLPPGLAQRARSGSDDQARGELLAVVQAALPALATAPETHGRLPPVLHRQLDDPTARKAIGRFVLDEASDDSLVPSPASEILDSALWRWDQPPETWRRNMHQVLQDKLRTQQMVWHLRWLMSALPLVYWAFACGLALWMHSGSRLLAVCLGLATVLVTLLPGVGLTKNTDGHLGFNPGWVMWSGWALLGAIGAGLLWRRR